MSADSLVAKKDVSNFSFGAITLRECSNISLKETKEKLVLGEDKKWTDGKTDGRTHLLQRDVWAHSVRLGLKTGKLKD